jgi:threonylcarbamoyladenosine tRNA methylthiotransferase MtaB
VGVETLSFGCRLNAAEADAMRAEADAAGHGRGGEPDLVVVNTCAVTAEAGRQARKAIRGLARARPGARIVVTGCGAQVETAAYAAMAEVDRLVGNGAKTAPATWVGLDAGPRVQVGDVMGLRAAVPSRLPAASRPRAAVPVQTGCDHRCTFCIIPFGRGNSRSVPADAVIAQVRAAVAGGAGEVVLTGVDLTAYGRDLAERPGLGGRTLGELVRAVLRAVPELPRLRLSSIDSVEADDALLAAFAEEPRLMPHLHLSLQAGDDLILKRMRRRHRRADAVAFCDAVRRLRPDVVLGADLIAGFPTEDEAMFANTLALVAACGLTHLHVFPYSARPGTPAARMPPVAHAVVRERAGRLRAAGAAALAAHLAGEVGQVRRVLVESPTTARTEGYATVRLARPLVPGSVSALAIAAHDGTALIAA